VKELHEEFLELIKAAEEETKRAQSKSSVLNTLGGNILPKLDNLITKVLSMDDLKIGISEIVLGIIQIKKDVEAAQYAEQVQVAFRMGQQLIAQAASNKTDELIKLEEEKTRVEALKEKILTGEIDPEDRRKPGQRPESIRNIRNAQKIIEETAALKESEAPPKAPKIRGKSRKKS